MILPIFNHLKSKGELKISLSLLIIIICAVAAIIACYIILKKTTPISIELGESLFR